MIPNSNHDSGTAIDVVGTENFERLKALLQNPELKDIRDLSYAEFIESVDEIFKPDELQEWQRQNLENWLEIWKDNPVKPKHPVQQVAKMLQMQSLKEETEAAIAAQKAKTQEPHMSYDRHGSKGAGLYCTCGGYKVHPREKVLNAWAWRHFRKTGHEMKKA